MIDGSLSICSKHRYQFHPRLSIKRIKHFEPVEFNPPDSIITSLNKKTVRHYVCGAGIKARGDFKLEKMT